MTPEVKKRIEQIRHGIVPEGYKKTAVGITPNDWKIRRLGDIADFWDDRRIPIKENERVSGTYPYYGASGVIDHVADYIFDGEYILLGEDGANIIERSSPLAFRVSGKCWINNHAHVLSPKDGYHIDYLTNYLESLSYVKYNSGTAQPKLNQDTCQKLPVVCGSFAEQKRIANILTAQDKIIELKEKLLAEKQRQKKYLMQQLLTGKKRLNGFTGDWITTKSAFEFKKGVQLNGDKLNETYSYPMYNGGMTPSGFAANSNCENAIIISEGGNSCGFVNYVRGRFWAGGHCYYVTSSMLYYSYLYQLLKYMEPYIMNMRVGSGLPNIQKNALANMVLTYPCDQSEQKAISDILAAADQEIELLRQNLEQENQKKKALMQLLLTGIVRVNA